MLRYVPLIICLISTFFLALLLSSGKAVVIALFLLAFALSIIGLVDLIQRHHSLRRNYPILAHIRFLLEGIRPEIRQYFLESDTDGLPFNRSKRAVVYQRSKHQLETRPFGTLQNVYESEFEWLSHSIAPAKVKHHDFRVMVGGPQCKQPYSISLINISAMSFGSLSANAIRALNKGAKMGGFAHDTGEGSISRYHREYGGDLIWEIGSGYFGCRTHDGHFSEERFVQNASNPQVKMIEVKLSQGAKPGHGGILPGTKVNEEIAATRGVEVGKDCISPASHSAFSTPIELLQFLARLRELSGGKPVGFKLCIGHRQEFMAICKAMIDTDILVDFIVIDGAEGGTGAAPLEFIDHLGMPLRDGLTFAHNCLIGAGLRDKIKLGASGRIITGFDMARVLALGADWCNIARGFMFSLGCIQGLACHTGRCPSGIATQDPIRQRALDVDIKAERVSRFHEATLKVLAELTGAAGLEHPSEITARHILLRGPKNDIINFADLYPRLAPDSLITNRADPVYLELWNQAVSGSFRPVSSPLPVFLDDAAAKEEKAEVAPFLRNSTDDLVITP